MHIKSFIKKILPTYLKNEINAFLFKKACKYYYEYDINRYIKYSNTFHKNDKLEKLLGLIIAEYHVIEKGLTMPEMRLGFGIETMHNLIEHCNLYSSRYDITNKQLLHAIEIIQEYKIIHERNNFRLDESIQKSINTILSKFTPISFVEQISTTKEEYFKDVNASFNLFSNSRHSLRDFKGTIKLEQIENAIQLAQNSPSACNRQQARVYIIQDRNRIKQVLNIQNGNRGFGHLADKLIILTAELSGFFSLKERNDVYVNGGIYAMNLLYSLHFYKIGAVTLNWCSSPEEDLALRKVIDIEPSETVILIIACGGVPDKFKIATSYRNDFTLVTKIR